VLFCSDKFLQIVHKCQILERVNVRKFFLFTAIQCNSTDINNRPLTQYSIVAVYHHSQSPPKLYLSIYCKFLSRKTMFCSITSTAGWSGLYPPSLLIAALTLRTSAQAKPYGRITLNRVIQYFVDRLLRNKLHFTRVFSNLRSELDVRKHRQYRVQKRLLRSS
jgi:hypothetical protein